MSTKQYKSYKDVNKKYKWDLSFLLDGKTPEERIDEILKLQKGLVKMRDSKYESSKSYMAYLKKTEKIRILINKLSNYLSNSNSQDVTNSKFIGLYQKFSFEMQQIDKELGSESDRFFKNEKKIKKWLELKEFLPYKHAMVKTLETKKHKLPKGIEEYIIKAKRGDVDPHAPFSFITNSEIEYGHITNSKGKKIEVTRANRTKLVKSKDAKVRKDTTLAVKNANLKHKQSLSNLLYQQFKSISSEAEIRKYDSAVQMLTFDDRVNDSFLQTLYKSVQDNSSFKTKYKNAYKKFYKVRFGEKPTKYDMARELVNVKTEFTVEEAKEMVLKSIKPFGKEYVDVVKKGFAENWVDFFAVKNKRSGAYSIGGTYGVHKKLILMNFNGTLDSVSTLAHEFGHSMHSYFSDTTRDAENSSYPIFLAEIASIFNELMLNDYLLENSDNDKLKFQLLEERINGVIGTVFRQVEWSNYEYDLYKAIDNGQPVGSYQEIAKIYYNNSVKYGNKNKYKEDDQYPSFYVPHFYYGFYVYKYAIGELVAQIFFRKYKLEGRGALQEYIKNFLSAGGHDHPINILKKSGIDLEDPSVYKLGFDSAWETLNEYIKLGKKIFKIK